MTKQAEDQPKDEWTAQELVAAATIKGYQSTGRLITDWVQIGLLDHPQRRGTGRGSAPAVWPREQAELFFLLLAKRQDVRQITTLANIPVVGWLWRDASGVTVNQVRRVMRSWIGARSHGGVEVARQTANQLIARITDDRVKAQLRTDLADHLLGLLVKRGDLAAKQSAFVEAWPNIHCILNEVHNAAGTKEDSAWAVAYNTIVSARLLGVTLFADEDQAVLTDDAIEDARIIYRATSTGYRLTNPPDAQHRISEELANNACLQLATIVGLNGGPAAPPTASPNRQTRRSKPQHRQ